MHNSETEEHYRKRKYLKIETAHKWHDPIKTTKF